MPLFLVISTFLIFSPWGFLIAQDAKELNREGLKAFQTGNYKDAMDFLRKAAQLDPKWGEPYFNIAQVMKAVKKLPEMRKALKIAFEREPANLTYREAYAHVLKDDLQIAQSAGEVEKARALSLEVISVNPADLEVAVKVVEDLVKKKDFSKAKTLALDVIEKNKAELPKYSSGSIGDLYFFVAKVELNENDLKNAQNHAERATRYPLEHNDEAKELLAKVKKTQIEGSNEHLKLGKDLVEKGQTNEAVEEFKKGLAIFPENEEIKAQMELIDTKGQAKEVFSKALKHISAEKWIEARDCLEQVLTLQPEHAEAKKLLKKAISFEDELKKKLGTTEPVPRSTADRMALTEGFVNMGQRYMQGGNFKDAKISFGRAMALIVLDAKLEKFKVIVDQQMEKINSVDNQAQLWDKGRELYKSNEYEECLKTLSQLPEDYLPAPDLLSILAFCHWKTGDSDKAKSLAQRQIVKQPNNNRAKFILGNIYASEGNNSAAYTILNEVKEADPDYPGIDDILYKVSAFKWGPLAIPLVVVGLLVWIAYIIHQKLPEFRKNSAINQARSLLNKNYPKDCIEKLAEVKKLPNISAFDGALISRLLAQAYLKTATYDRAIGECKHLISINPQDSEAQKWLGFSYLGRRAMTPESLPVLLNLYKSEKNNVALLGLLGQHYISQKVLAPEGVDILEKWLESEPNNPDVIKGLGKFYLQKGRSDPPAMKVFEMMMELKQQDPEVLLGIAKVQMRLNNQQSCLQICEKVLSLDVNNELVHSVLRESYQKVGKIPDLLEIYRAFLGENPYNVAFQRGFAAASKLAEKEQISSASKSPSEVNRPQSEVPPQVSEATVSSPAEPAEGQTICPHCSKPNSQADYYCQHCGKSVI